MKIVAWLFAVLVSALAAAAGGYWRGHVDGSAAREGRQAVDTVRQLTSALEAHRDLITRANEASEGLRKAMAARATEDRAFAKEFRDALKQTAAARAGCRFDDAIVRQLDAARERAAQAAAGGGAATVPAAGAGAGP